MILPKCEAMQSDRRSPPPPSGCEEFPLLAVKLISCSQWNCGVGAPVVSEATPVSAISANLRRLRTWFVTSA